MILSPIALFRDSRDTLTAASRGNEKSRQKNLTAR